MEFAFTEDQEAFRDSVSRFVEQKSTTADVRRLMASDKGYDESVWQTLASDLALSGLIIPEEFGGSGFGARELGIVMEEFGRSLICVPYFASSVMAASAIMLHGSQHDKETWLPTIADGSKRATLCVSEGPGLWNENEIKANAVTNKKEYLLSGRKQYVVDAQTSDFLIVAAHSEDGLSYFTVDSEADSVEIQIEQSMDETRKIATIDFNASPGQVLGAAGKARLDPVLDFSSVALAHEMVGGAQKMLDSAISYTKLRVQFGRSISSFQAIKHRLSDLLLEVELAKSACYHAAYTLDNHQEGGSSSASHAKAQASEAFINSAIQCIQLHGGVGFTWENDTHLWFKRAKSSEVFLGAPHEHRERMLVANGL